MKSTKLIVLDEEEAERMASRADIAEEIASVIRAARVSLFSTSDRSSRKAERKARMRELQRKAFLGQ